MTRNHIIGVAFVILCLLFVATRIWVRKGEGADTPVASTEQAIGPQPASAPQSANGTAGSNGTGAPDEARALAFYKQGCSAFNNKNFDQSFDLFKRAIELNPNNAHFYNDMAAVCFFRRHAGDIEIAESLLRKAAELQPDNCDYWSNLAKALCEENKLDEARSALEKASQCNPTEKQSAEIEQNLTIIEKALGASQAVR